MAHIWGAKINGYINGIQLFSYTTNVQVTFSNGSHQTLYNVPLGNHTTSDLQQYGLTPPSHATFNGNQSFNITKNCSININVNIPQGFENVNIIASDTGETLLQVTIHGSYGSSQNPEHINYYTLEYLTKNNYMVEDKAKIQNGTTNVTALKMP